MQAIERHLNSDNWITILLLVLLICVFTLKALNPSKLKNIVIAFFNKGFVESEAEEKGVFLNGFYLMLFIFSIIVFSTSLYFILIAFSVISDQGYIPFGKITLLVIFYFIIKRSLEYLLSMLFFIREEIRFFLVSKSIYLFSISFFCFIAIILFSYTGLNVYFISFFLFLFFFIRIIFLLRNNKKLILSELFYFFLYICAFETAPLFILFKFMF